MFNFESVEKFVSEQLETCRVFTDMAKTCFDKSIGVCVFFCENCADDADAEMVLRKWQTVWNPEFQQLMDEG